MHIVRLKYLKGLVPKHMCVVVRGVECTLAIIGTRGPVKRSNIICESWLGLRKPFLGCATAVALHKRGAARASPSVALPTPSTTTAVPLRAPKTCCAASPPAPWQTGSAPKPQPARFITPTDIATAMLPAACRTPGTPGRSASSARAGRSASSARAGVPLFALPRPL
eukprot:1191160-Prorocentrum_minimum.AAC.1